MNTTLKVKIGQFNTETQDRLMELLNILYDQHKDVSIGSAMRSSLQLESYPEKNIVRHRWSASSQTVTLSMIESTAQNATLRRLSNKDFLSRFFS